MKLFLKLPFWALLILVFAACVNTTPEQSDVISTSKDPVLVMFYTEN